MKVVVHVDGGARGNPGPAAAAAVLSDAVSGQVLDEATEFLGYTTNNVAEYRGLLLGLARAAALGADAVEVIELRARRQAGQRRVQCQAPRHAGLAWRRSRPWRLQRLGDPQRPALQNADADALVNQALDAAREVVRPRLPYRSDGQRDRFRRAVEGEACGQLSGTCHTEWLCSAKWPTSPTPRTTVLRVVVGDVDLAVEDVDDLVGAEVPVKTARAVAVPEVRGDAARRPSQSGWMLRATGVPSIT